MLANKCTSKKYLVNADEEEQDRAQQQQHVGRFQAGELAQKVPAQANSAATLQIVTREGQRKNKAADGKKYFNAVAAVLEKGNSGNWFPLGGSRGVGPESPTPRVEPIVMGFSISP